MGRYISASEKANLEREEKARTYYRYAYTIMDKIGDKKYKDIGGKSTLIEMSYSNYGLEMHYDASTDSIIINYNGILSFRNKEFSPGIWEAILESVFVKLNEMLEEKERKENEETLKRYLFVEVTWLNSDEESLKEYELEIFKDDHIVEIESNPVSINLISLYYKGKKVISGYLDEFGDSHVLTYVPGEWESYLGTCRKLQQKHEDELTLKNIRKLNVL